MANHEGRMGLHIFKKPGAGTHGACVGRARSVSVDWRVCCAWPAEARAGGLWVLANQAGRAGKHQKTYAFLTLPPPPKQNLSLTSG